MTVEARGEVALVRIDRPPANAMDLELLDDGQKVLSELAAAAPGAVVLTGREGFFSAGVDLKVAPTLDAAGQREMVAGINRLFAGWYEFARPVVCAVNGHAIAGGLILALCADLRIGNGEGKLGLTELKAGIPYPAVAMAVVKAELSPQAARRLVLEAELLDQRTAFEFGVLDELVEPDDLLGAAIAVAERLAAHPRSAYEIVKVQLRSNAVADAKRVAAGDDPLARGWLLDETAGAASSLLER